MGLFPRWSKEKLTPEEESLKETLPSFIEDKKKAKQRLRDECVDDLFEETNLDVDINLAESALDELGKTYRTLKYPYD